MKRMHIHIAVNNINESISFYSKLFAAIPSVVREDYVKWDLDDPAVNFAISNRSLSSGINHLGIQVESDDELKEIAQRLNDADIDSSTQEGQSCCYSRSNKHWILDPQGIAWESFHTLAAIPVFGEDTLTDPGTDPGDETSACCIPLRHDQTNDAKADCCIPHENDAAGCCT